jgi:hypothetical protein
MKSIGSFAKYTLLAIWIIAIALTISIGIKQASAFAADGRVVKKELSILILLILCMSNLNTMITMQKH